MSIDSELRRAAEEHRTRFEHVAVPDLPERAHHRIKTATVAVAALAVVAIAAVVVAVAVHTNGSPRQLRVVTPSTTPPPSASAPKLRDTSIDAAPLLAPTWAPDGEQLWSVSSTGGARESGFPSQLFGTASADGTLTPGLVLEYQSASPGESIGGANATVRGAPAAVGEPKDAAGADAEIRWIEGSTQVTAIFRGVSNDGAVAVLNALQPRGSDLSAGFDPASAPPEFGLLGERNGSERTDASADAVFRYAPADGAPDIEVATFTHDTYPGYFRARLGGHIGAGGVVVQPDAYSVYHLVTLAWPDGRSVRVQTISTDASALERIARSVQLISRTQAQSLAEDVNARLAALPVLDTASLPSGTLEVHRTGQRIGICLRGAEGLPVCASDVGHAETSNAIAGSALLDGHWYIFGGAPDVDVIATVAGALPTPNPAPIPTQRATVGEWHVAVVPIPADVGVVQLTVPTAPNQFSGFTLTRPNANA